MEIKEYRKVRFLVNGRIMKEKNLRAQEMENYSYRPKINNPNMNAIFSKTKNIQNLPPSKKFIKRLEEAREEQEFKKSRLYKWKRSKSLVMSDISSTPVNFF